MAATLKDTTPKVVIPPTTFSIENLSAQELQYIRSSLCICADEQVTKHWNRDFRQGVKALYERLM